MVKNDLKNFKYASIIVTFNRKKLLIESVMSVLLQTCTPDFVIIVDNASTDGTADALKEKGILNDKRIKYIRLNANIGGSGGFYAGLKFALLHTDVNWVSLSDDDAIYASNYFEELSRMSREKSDVLAFAGQVEFPDHEIQLGHRKMVANNGRFSTTNVSKDNYDMLHFYADFASFVGLVISTNLIRKIGLPEKKYFIWFDDLEYSIRIRKHSKIMIVPAAIITHKTSKEIHGKDSDKKNQYNWKQYYGYRNRILMVKKHSKTPFISILEIIVSIIKWQVTHFFTVHGKNNVRSMKQSFDAINDGLRGRDGKNEKYLPK